MEEELELEVEAQEEAAPGPSTPSAAELEGGTCTVEHPTESSFTGTLTHGR